MDDQGRHLDGAEVGGDPWHVMRLEHARRGLGIGSHEDLSPPPLDVLAVRLGNARLDERVDIRVVRVAHRGMIRCLPARLRDAVDDDQPHEPLRLLERGRDHG